MILITKERDVVALFAEVTLIAEVEWYPFKPDIQAALPTPGQLFEFSFIAIIIRKFRGRMKKIVADWTSLYADRAKFYAQQYRDIQILVFLILDYICYARLADFVIYFIGIKKHLRLDKKMIAKARVHAKLGSEISPIQTKIKVGISNVTDRNFILMIDLGIKTSL